MIESSKPQPTPSGVGSAKSGVGIKYLEVDGGVDVNTAPKLLKAGANVLVAGNAIFSQKNISLAVRRLKQV